MQPTHAPSVRFVCSASFWRCGGAGSVIFYAVLVVVGAWMTVSAIRGGLIVRDDGVEVRDLRSRFIPWRDIENFYVGGNWSVVPWSRLHIRLRSEDAIIAPYVASVGPIGPNLDAIATELNGLRGRA